MMGPVDSQSCGYEDLCLLQRTSACVWFVEFTSSYKPFGHSMLFHLQYIFYHLSRSLAIIGSRVKMSLKRAINLAKESLLVSGQQDPNVLNSSRQQCSFLPSHIETASGLQHNSPLAQLEQHHNNFGFQSAQHHEASSVCQQKENTHPPGKLQLPGTPHSQMSVQSHDLSSDEECCKDEVGTPPRRFLAKRRVRMLLIRHSSDTDTTNQKAIEEDQIDSDLCGFFRPEFPSLHWWVNPMLAALRPILERNAAAGGLAFRPVKLMNCCSSGAEVFNARALGIPWSTESMGNEKNDRRRRFFADMHSGHVKHIVRNQSAFCKESGTINGFCDIHNTHCIQEVKQVHFMSGGPPCPPFSNFRQNKSVLTPSQHPDWNALLGPPGCPEGSFVGSVEMRKAFGG